MWVPVSGKVESTDADLEAAARRELAEETGIDRFVAMRPLDWEVVFDAPVGSGTWRLHGFEVELKREISPVLSLEHEAFEWVDADEAVRRLHFPDNREAVERLRRRVEDPGRNGQG